MLYIIVKLFPLLLYAASVITRDGPFFLTSEHFIAFCSSAPCLFASLVGHFCSLSSIWCSDVRSKAFEAVEQFLQLVKQYHEKVCELSFWSLFLCLLKVLEL